jgi:TPR repeat protein
MRAAILPTMLALAVAHPVAASDSDWTALLANGLAAHQRGDYAAAAPRLRQLADQGSAIAETMLGVMAARGEGRRPDAAVAAGWWLRAARRGYAPAQLALAQAMAAGRGVSADAEGAWLWARLASASSEPDVAGPAAELAQTLARGITPARLAELERVRAGWRPWSR